MTGKDYLVEVDMILRLRYTVLGSTLVWLVINNVKVEENLWDSDR